MNVDGTISWENFLSSITKLVEVSNRINDGWALVGEDNTPGGLYLVKKVDNQNKSHPETALSDLEEPMLETKMFDSATSHPKQWKPASSIEYHVIYSQSYAVPVLFFNHWKPDGSLVPLEDTWQSIHPAFLPGIRSNQWATLTQQEHPIQGRPFYQLHPCRTAQLLKCSAEKSCNPVVTWLSSIGPAVGLQLCQEYASLVTQQ